MENNIWILHSEYYDGFIYQTTLEIKSYLENMGVKVETFNYRAFKFNMENGEECLYYHQEKITTLPKVVFARSDCYKLMHYFDAHGVKVINGFMNMVHMKDKWQTYLDLERVGIAQPKTINSKQVMKFEDVVNGLGLPFIVKYRFGSQGKSVFLIKTEQDYIEILNRYHFDDIILQKYIETSYGKDIRIFVVGDRYFGAVRDNSANDFRANLAQGGITYKFEIPNQLLSTIDAITKEINAEIVGLDFLFDHGNFTFCEANGNAGYKAFLAQNIDMSKIIAEYIHSKYFKE